MRRHKDRIGETLFAHGGDPVSDLAALFCVITSIWFQGEGNEELGRCGHTKERWPDITQTVALF